MQDVHVMINEIRKQRPSHDFVMGYDHRDGQWMVALGDAKADFPDATFKHKELPQALNQLLQRVQ